MISNELCYIKGLYGGKGIYLGINDLYNLLKFEGYSIIKDEISPNILTISKNFNFNKDGIIYHRMRIKELKK